jgi:hypothetical protein
MGANVISISPQPDSADASVVSAVMMFFNNGLVGCFSLSLFYYTFFCLKTPQTNRKLQEHYTEFSKNSYVPEFNIQDSDATCKTMLKQKLSKTYLLKFSV